MKATSVYLHFEGSCREAMTFYGQCFGTTSGFTPYSETPPGEIAGADQAPDLIMHSEMALPGLHLMASDILPGDECIAGNNFSISVQCESNEELERLFWALLEGGTMDKALYDAFWGDRIGLLTDKFGVKWMLSFR